MQNISCLTSKIKANSAIYKCMLILIWSAGLLLGIFLANEAPATTLSMMRTPDYPRVSIIGLVLIVAFPLITSAIAVRLCFPLLCFIFAFLKAICFSYCASCISVVYGSAGWLVRLLLVFSDSCAIAVFLWFCFRHIAGNRGAIKRDTIICVSLTVLFCCVDYYVVSPFVEILLCH